MVKCESRSWTLWVPSSSGRSAILWPSVNACCATTKQGAAQIDAATWLKLAAPVLQVVAELGALTGQHLSDTSRQCFFPPPPVNGSIAIA